MNLLRQLLELQSVDASLFPESHLYDQIQKHWPKLAKQLKMAWDGDVRAAGKGEKDLLFPRLLKYDQIKRFEPDFPHTNATRQLITDVYDLFRKAFRISGDRKWFLEGLPRPSDDV